MPRTPGNGPGTRHRTAERVVGYQGRKRSILIADDKTENRHILGSFLRSLGFEVREAADGQQALDEAARARPDLVFMDLVMPMIDGFEATRRLRGMPGLDGVPIVAVSASAFDITRSESEQAGADGFLAKPVKLDEVIAIMGRLLSLEWTCNGQSQNAVHAVAAPPAGSNPLPTEVVDELHQLALIGDVRALTERLDALEREQRIAPGALDALRGLARNYDMKAIRAYLRPEQAAGSGGHVSGAGA